METNYRQEILDCLAVLKSSAPPGLKSSYENLEAVAKEETRPVALFGMLQTLREVLAEKMASENVEPVPTTFFVRMPDGSLVAHDRLKNANSKNDRQRMDV